MLSHMLTDRDIIVFSDDWGRHPSSCQHLIKQLLPHNRIIWVNTIGMRSPRLSLHDLTRSFQILAGWLARAPETEREPASDNLTVVSPVIVPYNHLPLVRGFNRLSVRRTLLGLMAEKGVKNPIVMTTFPCTCDYVGALGESIHIYYCVDDFVNWPDVNYRLIKEMEQNLLDHCDLVLATAEELCNTKSKPGKQPLLLSHGVDFDRFNACAGAVERPEQLRGIAKPVIGFFGALSAWLDYDLIAELATARPQWSFVFIGPADSDISRITGLTNIHLIGKVPYEQLPRYAACFDAGIIPFQVNELTRSVNPLKLLEYLSLGIPVVSSYMPDVARFSDVVSIAHSPQDFLAALDRALADDTSELRQERIEKARGNSWQAVAERFSQLVTAAENTIKDRPGCARGARA